jgi:hypothetical protein
MTIELAIALWGAIVSTVLGVIMIFENQRKLLITLTHFPHYQSQEMYVTNIGKRTVTIKEVGIRIIRTKEELINYDPLFSIPIFPIPEEDNRVILPVKIEEGESLQFKFMVSEDDIYEKGRLQAYALDTSEKEYSTKEVRLFNARFHYAIGKVTKKDSHKHIMG